MSTRLGQDYRLGDEDDVLFACADHTRRFLVYLEGPRQLRVHIEHPLNSNKLETLKRTVENVSDSFCAFLNAHYNEAKQAKIVIWVEDNDFLLGKRTTVGGRVRSSLLDNVWTKIYVPIATFFISAMMEYEVKRSAFNALASIGALLLWTIWDVFVSRKAYEYEEI